jgi:hypothetical protein
VWLVGYTEEEQEALQEAMRLLHQSSQCNEKAETEDVHVHTGTSMHNDDGGGGGGGGGGTKQDPLRPKPINKTCPWGKTGEEGAKGEGGGVLIHPDALTPYTYESISSTHEGVYESSTSSSTPSSTTTTPLTVLVGFSSIAFKDKFAAAVACFEGAIQRNMAQRTTGQDPTNNNNNNNNILASTSDHSSVSLSLSLLSMATQDVINTECPWSNKPVSLQSSSCVTVYRNYNVAFCNDKCRDKFAAAVSLFNELIQV